MGLEDNEEMLCWLISHGAFLRLKDKRGECALAGARGSCVTLLLQEAYSPLERAVYAPGGPTASQLEAQLDDFNADTLSSPLWDEAGGRLHMMITMRHGRNGFDALESLRWLANRGVDFEALDEEGNALLHMIDWSFGADVVLPLLNWAFNEARVTHCNLRNRAGWTPALLCAENAASGDDAFRCLQVLEANLADLALGNAKGANVPMIVAKEHGDGPWIEWCFTQGGVDRSAVCGKGQTVADYLVRHDIEESDDSDENETESEEC